MTSAMSTVERAAVVAIALCAVAVTGMMVHNEFFRRPSPSGPQPPEAIKDWRSFVAGNATFGSPSAPITVTEFSDFQCPFCAKFFAALEEVRAKRPNDIRVVFRHFPLRMHPMARPAAIAAQCAADQSRFSDYYDYLFRHQDSLATLNWVTVAASVGVSDTAAFRRCEQSTAPTARLRADSVDAARLDVVGTPTVMVNGWRFHGTPSAAQLDSAVTKELAHGK